MHAFNATTHIFFLVCNVMRGTCPRTSLWISLHLLIVLGTHMQCCLTSALDTLVKRGKFTSDIVVIELVTESVEILSHTRHVGIGNVLLT